MDAPVRILAVEESRSDAALLEESIALEAPAGELELSWRQTLVGARALLEEESFDCVLLDLSLPDASGLEGIMALAAEFPDVPIVVLTGNDDAALAIDAVKSGAQDYLLKGEVSGRAVARSLRYAIERKRSSAALRSAEERFRSAFEGAPIGIAVLESDGCFVEANDAWCSIVGYSPDQLASRSLPSLVHLSDSTAVEAAISGLLGGSGRTAGGEWRLLHAGGATIWVALRLAALADHTVNPRIIAQVQDMTERRQLEDRLRYMAERDPLTGLLNRSSFEQELEGLIGSGSRHHSRGALLVVDIDRFKDVNDCHGHATGDELLTQVAAALRGRLRRDDSVARLGGDEFGVLLADADAREAQTVADELLRAVGAITIATEGHILRVSATIGVARFADAPENTGEEMMINAELAMYDAKTAGRNRAAVFVPERDLGAESKKRIAWADRIREALAGERFELFAQPIRDLRTGEEDRCEFLLRMRDETGDLIPPGAFLDVAERVGLIAEIDRWVVRRAIGLAGRELAGSMATIEVNLSGASIGDPRLLELIENRLYSEGVQPERVVFEITETAAVAGMHEAREFAGHLRQLGCRFALDDFGSGFGSFYYLKHLPFDYLKIDGEFVRSCLHDPTDRLVIESVVGLARGLGRKTIAEYVEDQPTLDFLAAHGVDYAQGFHVGRPQSIAETLAARPRREPDGATLSPSAGPGVRSVRARMSGRAPRA
ncbi:MAG: putative bifunctional diguanylate cyclase/phosphodiesterase [Solirubrobacterales bacterium]